MGKNKNKNQKNDQYAEVKELATDFAYQNEKKFVKKRCKEDFMSEKKARKLFYEQLIDYLPEAIEYCLLFGYRQNDQKVQETKMNIYSKITEKKFIKALTKRLEDDDAQEIKNIKLLPVLISDIIFLTSEENKRLLSEDPDAAVYDLNEIVDLSKLILAKKIKKLTKLGISEGLAYDILSICPSPKIFNYGTNYRIHTLFRVLYEHAKTEDINIDDILNTCIPEDRMGTVCMFALLERKSKTAHYTDKQNKLFDDITKWVFDYMEHLSNDEISTILETYVESRKRDDLVNKDTERRFFIKSLSATDYPNIVKVAQKLIATDPTADKYF